MSSVETGQMSAVETGQMTAAETSVLSQQKKRKKYRVFVCLSSYSVREGRRSEAASQVANVCCWDRADVFC